jgi:HptB-dependent secretion and biofilm anti anti-sigma factor
MNINVQKLDGRACVMLNGRFDFYSHREFRTACDGALQDVAVHSVDIDFGQVEYLDSSALGMLLQVRERARGMSRSMRLVNCKGVVGDVIKVANFGKLFDIA